MIRCPLTFHSPQTVYSFLKQQVGPPYMLIKRGQALIHFVRSDLAKVALDKYQHFLLKGMPLELYPYDGDIDKLPPLEYQGAMIPQQHMLGQNQVSIPPPKYSEFTMAVEEGLKIKDPDDQLERITKEYRKQMVEFINTYDLLHDMAEKRAKDIQSSMVPEQNGNGRSSLKKFYDFYEGENKAILRDLKDNFKRAKNRTSKFQKRENALDLEPPIAIRSQSHTELPDSKGFKLRCSYLNTGNYSDFKRTVALNQEHFVVSAHNNSAGKLLFYKEGEEFLQGERDIRGGAYGLCTLDEHILVGDWEGRLSFFRSPYFTETETSIKLHPSVIFNLCKIGTLPNGYLIATNSVDGTLKLIQGTLENFGSEETTLYYKQAYDFPDLQQLLLQKKGIVTTITHFKDQLMAFAKDNEISVFDCEALKTVSTHMTSKAPQILKISTVDQTTIAAACEKHLTLIDIYNNAKTLNIKIGKFLRTVTTLSQHRILYACESGQMGIVDRRKGKMTWHDSHQHKTRIYDVAKMNSGLISIDKGGQILTWNSL